MNCMEPARGNSPLTRMQAAAFHGRLEVGLAGNPVVDGAPRHAKELAQFLVGGAEQAVVARLIAEVGPVGRGTSVGVHAATITEVQEHFKNFFGGLLL